MLKYFRASKSHSNPESGRRTRFFRRILPFSIKITREGLIYLTGVLVLFIAAIGAHLAMTGLGLAVFGTEGSRIDPLIAGVAATALVMAGLYSVIR